MEKNISVERAQELLLANVKIGAEENIPLLSGLGRVLSQDLQARENIPPFVRSPLDGYAIRALDTVAASRQSPVILQVLEEVAAGHLPHHQVRPGTTIKVMTGAPLPQGADVVVRFEDVQRAGSSLSLFAPLRCGDNIVNAGEDVAVGDIVGQPGELVTPPHVGLAAALGLTTLPVYRLPRVTIISTGDELMDAGQELLPGKIRNSNLYTLYASCQKIGVQVSSGGIVTDGRPEIAARMLSAAAQSDLVISTGGVSVGDHDVVEEALQDAGARIIFSRIAMKPGTPTLAAELDGKLIVALSGNPAAALVGFDLLVLPLLKKMMGCADYLPPLIPAILGDGFKKGGSQRRFLRGRLDWTDGVARFMLTGVQNPGVLKSMVGCNALADIPANNGPLVAGSRVNVVFLGSL